jgi:hypothetical protein
MATFRALRILNLARLEALLNNNLLARFRSVAYNLACDCIGPAALSALKFSRFRVDEAFAFSTEGHNRSKQARLMAFGPNFKIF